MTLSMGIYLVVIVYLSGVASIIIGAFAAGGRRPVLPLDMLLLIGLALAWPAALAWAVWVDRPDGRRGHVAGPNGRLNVRREVEMSEAEARWDEAESFYAEQEREKARIDRLEAEAALTTKEGELGDGGAR